jgi:hypothetical protein
MSRKSPLEIKIGRAGVKYVELHDGRLLIKDGEFTPYQIERLKKEHLHRLPCVLPDVECVSCGRWFQPPLKLTGYMANGIPEFTHSRRKTCTDSCRHEIQSWELNQRMNAVRADPVRYEQWKQATIAKAQKFQKGNTIAKDRAESRRRVLEQLHDGIGLAS